MTLRETAAPPRESGRQRETMTPLYRLNALFVRPLIRIVFRPFCLGLRHVPTGPFVVAPNQLSNLDGWAVAFVLLPRQARWMGKAELFDNPITRPLARSLGIFPVRRGEGDRAALASAVGLTRDGHIVGIFPEGTRRRKGLRKRRRPRPHSGAARVALEAGVPLVPAAVRGTDELLRLRRWGVAFGAPVPLDDLAGLPPARAAREATKRLMGEIGRLERDLEVEAGAGRRVYPRLLLDISFRDLVYAAGACLLARGRANRQRAVAHRWSEEGVACLSVRSGLDLLLSALALPPESEVLVSAVTHPDMARIVRAHGLVPVPVDLDLDTLAPAPAALERAAGPRCRAILVAHLFGGRVDLDPLVELARRRGLLLVEDCAQAFRGPQDTGDPRADVSLFSFGTIKTATALGGALVRVRDPGLRKRMEELQSEWPVQGRAGHMGRVLKTAGLVVLARPAVFGVFVRACALLRRDVDGVLAEAVRGFPGDAAELLRRIRRQPSAPLLALLARRLDRFDAERLGQRAGLGERVSRALPPRLTHPGHAADDPTHWVFPVLTDDPGALVERLRRNGLDAARGTTAIGVVDGAAPEQRPVEAERLMASVVFLPVYPELPERVVNRLLGVLARVERE